MPARESKQGKSKEVPAAIAAASLVERFDETEPDTFDEDPGRDDTDDLPSHVVESE